METITDIHNRRKNIDYVAQWHQEHAKALSIWPEDKLLLRITDLPVMEGFPGVARAFYPKDNSALRKEIQIGKRYSRTTVMVGGMTIDEVSEYR